MNVIYNDGVVILAIKPAGVLSTDEPGGMPELLRAELNTDEIRTVHRLDRVVSGLMLLARSSACASELSRQIREGEFHKEYLAVVHGVTAASGELRDLMYRDKARRMSFVTDTPAVGGAARIRYAGEHCRTEPCPRAAHHGADAPDTLPVRVPRLASGRRAEV